MLFYVKTTLLLVVLFWSSTVFAEKIWMGLLLTNNVLIPFAEYQNGKWLEVWNPPRVWGNESYYQKHGLPQPEMDSSTEMLAIQKTASIKQLPPEWIDGKSLPLKWYGLDSEGEYEVTQLIQYDMNCDVSWGLNAIPSQNTNKAPSYVVSQPVYSQAFQVDVENIATKKVLERLLEQAVNKERQNLRQYESPQQCEKEHTEKHKKYRLLGNNYAWNAKHEKQLAGACKELLATKDRDIFSLDYITVQRAKSSSGSYLYHSTASLFFPNNNAALSVVHLDSWFLVDKNKVSEVAGCGESIDCTCSKGSYSSYPSALFEFDGHRFILDEQSCYFGGNKIYELIDGSLKEVLSKGWGGC